MSSIVSSSLPPIMHQDILESAARLVDRQLQEDRNYTDLSEQLRIAAHNQPSVSGLQDYDYPSLNSVGVPNDSLQEVGHIKRVPLPPELLEQFGRMQCNCMMGLFPEVERAWLTIDSDIFVWRYEDGGDLAYFDGLNETVICAALVKPKIGIFQPRIQYLLVLATAVDIILLGVSFNNPQEGVINPGRGEMHLLPDALFTLATDNTSILNITGTATGRIFMTAKDGCLYELAYQADGGWFSRKCKKINHSTSTLSFLVPSFLTFSFSEDDPLVQITVDDSRHVLYTRSDKGTLQVYDLGSDGKGMSRVASIPLHTTVQNASAVARTIDRSNFKTLVHIAAIPATESFNIHLVAVTQTGVRLYFATNPFGSKRSHPTMLTLVHVRLPPGFAASASPRRPNNVHLAHHNKGTLMLVCSQSEESDALWAVSGDSFPFQNQLMEAQTTVPIEGKTWAICEISRQPSRVREGTPVMPTIPDPPLVVSQHAELARRYVLLSAQGSHILHKLRPVDQLRQLLIDNQGTESEEIKAFFRLHKVEQACATCLVLACSRVPADQQVSDWARMAFFLYGGEALYNYSAPSSTMHPSNIGPSGLQTSFTSASPSNTIVYSPSAHATSFTPGYSTPIQGMHPVQMSTPNASFGQHPYYHPNYPVTAGYTPEVLYSGKHNGICLYLGRILRPIWDAYITSDFQSPNQKHSIHYLTCSFSEMELSCLLELVRDLSDFVDFNSRFDSPLPANSFHPSSMAMMSVLQPLRFDGGPGDEETKKKLQADAQTIEKLSLQHIQELIHRVEEIVGLLKVLVDHQFHHLVATLSQDQQSQLRSMTFKQLVINGKDMCGSLITCLIRLYLNDNATVDAMSSHLRTVCPSLYSSDDVRCSKANELLNCAKINQNQLEKKEQLKESLKLYKEVSQPLQLPLVCNQFASVQFYDGIVDLCLTAAIKSDPQNLSLHYYNCGKPPEDKQGMHAYMNRLECYKCITETLGHLLSMSVSHPHTPSIPTSPGPPPVPDPNRLSTTEAFQYKEQIFKMALQSEDEMFHIELYDWLFSMNLTEKLLEISSPYLETYLKRKASFQTDNIAPLDMLWKHYEKTRNFPAAARILTRLAERHGNDVNLQQRLEYLSRAIMCAKSSTTRTSSATEGEFLHELEEKMEVARLQMQVSVAINKLNSSQQHVQDAMGRLDCDLYDITMLYEQFAERFDLSECKLAIVHCAGLCDEALIESLWQSIIDKDMNTAASSQTQTRMINISNRLISIGRLYVGTERYFPLAFIVKYLEQSSCQLNFDPQWVFKAMQDIGVKAAKLLEIYDRMLKSRDPFWQTIKKPLHLLTVLYYLLNNFTENMGQIPASERRHFSTVCLDAVASYLVELQAISSTDSKVRQLVQLFKALQAKLERI